MIKDWQHFNLAPNFNEIKTTGGKPSDLDMFYITQDKFLIIGEFKNGDMGKLKPKQKELFETFIDNYKYGGIIVYATHHKLIENGDLNYDAATCEVEQYYLKGQWRKPKKHTIVQDIFDRYDKEIKMEIVSDREEMIFRKDYNGKPFYSIGLSKKTKNGTYENGYMSVYFKSDVTLRNKTKIMIKSAWLSFNLKENKTYPYIFINDFTITDEGEMQETRNNEVNPFAAMKEKVESDIGKQIKIDDNDLPFDEPQLPF